MGSEIDIEEGYDGILEEAASGPGVWLHVPARGRLSVVLLRDRPVKYLGHFSPGRGAIPCKNPRGDPQGSCPECERGRAAKRRYVYSVLDVSGGRPGLVEVAPETAIQIMKDCADHGFSKGLAFDLFKLEGKVNGRIMAKCRHTILSGTDLPDGPDPAYVLRKQWYLPEVAVDFVTAE